jgi:hypothetical protein
MAGDPGRLQELPEIGAEGPVGFWGIMQGIGIGVPLTAVEPRITVADFGVLGHESLTEATAEITVPVEFLLPWDGEHVERQSGLVGELRAQERDILRVSALPMSFSAGCACSG